MGFIIFWVISSLICCACMWAQWADRGKPKMKNMKLFVEVMCAVTPIVNITYVCIAIAIWASENFS